MAKIKGQLEDAQLHNQGTDPTNRPEGLAWVNTSTSKAKIVVGAAVREIITADQAQTLTNKTITSPAGLVKADVGLGSVDNTSDASKPISTAAQAALDLKAPIASPTFTGTVSGVTAAMVGLGNVDNTSDLNKPISTATATSLATKASLTGAETLTSKTLTTPVIDVLALTDQASTPSNPSAGTHKAYVKTSTGKLTILDSSGTEVTVGSGSGSTNFITNADAEAGTTGWAAHIESGTKPTFGYSQVPPANGDPAPTNTLSASSTSPLSGTKSFQYDKGTGSKQGEGFHSFFTIDAANKAKVMQISFDYRIVSGTFSPGTSSTDSDLTVWIVAGVSTLIQPSSYKLTSNSTTLATRFTATFQTTATDTDYNLVFHNGTTTTAAYSIQIDNVSVAPSTYVYGSPVTDWQAYTPTLTGSTNGSAFTNQTTSGRWRRVGDSVEIQLSTYFTGAPGGGTGYFRYGIPSALSIDTSKLSSPLNTATAVGNVFTYTTGGSAYYEGAVLYDTLTQVALAGNVGTGTYFGPTAPGTYGNTNQISLTFKVPIQGWSSSVQMSDQTDTRVVAAVYDLSANQAVAASGTIKYDRKVLDTHGAYNTATGIYTVPVPGVYELGATGNANGTCTLFVSTSVDSRYIVAMTASVTVGTTAILGFLNAGSTIQVRSDSAVSFYGPAGGLALNTVSIKRLSGPSAIAASEAMYASIGLTSSQAVSANGVIKYDTVNDDSHGCYSTSTGLYTPNIAGTFKISITSSTSSIVNAYVKVNGVSKGYLCGMPSSGFIYSASIFVKALAGQGIGIYVDGAATMSAAAGNGFVNCFNIERVK